MSDLKYFDSGFVGSIDAGTRAIDVYVFRKILLIRYFSPEVTCIQQAQKGCRIWKSETLVSEKGFAKKFLQKEIAREDVKMLRNRIPLTE